MHTSKSTPSYEYFESYGSLQFRTFPACLVSYWIVSLHSFISLVCCRGEHDTYSEDAEARSNGELRRSSSSTVELQTCISKIKEISYYCNQFSLASLSARDNRPITEREFIEMYEFYCRMDPVLSFIFQFNNNGDDYLTCEELEAFLKVEFSYLPSRVEDNYLAKVIAHFEPVPILRAENCLGMDGLITYLLSPDLSIMNPFHTQVTHDMSHPMTHYFINSSHNSFLTGKIL